RWFAAHYPQFVYIDRIVIANAYRRHGLGRIFYSDVHSYAEVRVPLLTCEVFLEPRDDVVVLFHGTYGFQEVDQQKMGPDGPQVSLLAKDLPSYAYVRDTWLEHGGLPDTAWLAERELPHDDSGLRFGQVGIACVRVRRVDAAALCDELERRVRAAPQMFARAAVVLDLSHLSSLPDDGAVDALLEAVRSAGMLPVGLAYGTSETEALAKRMDLPLIAKF